MSESRPQAPASSRGRPRVSSRAVLEEAAYELFLEQGYDGTTVADIARRAGVSRGTFFNYFPAKADVFWGDVDEALDSLPAVLRETDAADEPAGAVRSGLLRLTDTFGPDRVPWILTQFDAMGRPAEVGVSAIVRMTRALEMLTQFAAARSEVGARELLPRTVAYSALAVTLAAAQTWAEAGPQRGRLSAHVARAFAQQD